MKVLGIVGSYRKNGVIDMVIQRVLDGARSKGFETEKIYLIDKNISYCKSCFNCQENQELEIGDCPQDDDMRDLLKSFREADRYVIGSPVFYESATAVMKAFIERSYPLTRYASGSFLPESRKRDQRKKKGVIVVSMGAPREMEDGMKIAQATILPMECILTMEIEKDTFIPQDNGTIEKIIIGGVKAKEKTWPDMDSTLKEAFKAGIRLSQ